MVFVLNLVLKEIYVFITNMKTCHYCEDFVTNSFSFVNQIFFVLLKDDLIIIHFPSIVLHSTKCA